MKTKIIYISGNELFNMSDVRAAFEGVRATLGLSNDTILFGVPVDADDALQSDNVSDTGATQTVIATEPENVAEFDTEPVVQPEPAPVVEMAAPKPDAPIKKSRGRPAKKSEIADNDKTDATNKSDDAKVVPILSVLATSKTSDEMPAVDDEIPSEIIENVPASEENTDAVAVESVSIISDVDVVDNMIENDVDESEPESDSAEKSLEKLLETMTPLREDHILENDVTESDDSDSNDETDDDDTDATLAQLASEFAQKQDSIKTQSKNQGKIGKLKNILPFKKVKHDDSSLMGDLFGWAGIAANDEDFTMPGFFTGVASKK